MSWIDKDTFNFWLPAQALRVTKGDDDGASDSGKRWIQGVASTDARDLQGEVVSQKGIDFSYFMKNGYFNNDHKDGFSNKVGQPTECRLTANGLWVKGFLFKNHKTADSIWELLNSLDSSSSSRRIGFSIQGKVKRRAGSTIKECWIQDVAITPSPVNTSTWAQIAKSLSTEEWDLKKDHDDCDDMEEEDEEKALQASGSPLVAESLHTEEIEDRTSKSLTFDETVALLQEASLTKEMAEAFAKAAFCLYGS
tara:strand:- start:9997 stop:10752 length:756 start_codon:yes stop_codon:yes gene_type:complete